jgi:hypothetical protein
MDAITNMRREPCSHTDLVWTSTDSAYCRECGCEMCAETSRFLRELVIIGQPMAATA